ncbi:MAG: hypothetical protein VXW45_01150 [Pseudomonadota bacterium]|nr:hypothetical protein [Pseudomonadota bacterium]
MPKVVIGQSEIDYEKLPNAAKLIINSIKSVDAQVSFKKEEIKVLGAAKAMYALKLQEIIERENVSEESAENWINELGDTIKFD